MSRTRGAAAAAGLALSLAALMLLPSWQREVAAASPGNTYVPISPVRILDTRTDGGTLGPGASLNVQVAGEAGVPSDAAAVAINVTVTDTTASSYLSVYPQGQSQPTVSNLNWVAGQTVANLALVPLGSSGQLTLYNSRGSADVVVDLQGYFTAQAGVGGDYVPLSPQRITDTRPGSGYPNSGDPLGAGQSLSVQVAGAGGVPQSGVAAAVLNVTVTDTTAASFLAVYPGTGSAPSSSNLNWVAGQTVANRVLVPLSSSGQVTVYNHEGSTDVVVDVSGYFASAGASPSGASLFYPLAPTRVLDTRQDAGRLGSASQLGVQFAGVGGISPEASAVVTNLTATATTRASFYRLSPGASGGATSDLNWVAGQTVANLDLAQLGAGGAAYLFNNQGGADAVIDVFGYFLPAAGAPAPADPCSAVSLGVTQNQTGLSQISVSASAQCPGSGPVQYAYWYLAPGSASWQAGSGWTTASTFEYQTAGQPQGSYQLIVWASTAAGVFQGALGEASALTSPNPAQNLPDTFEVPCYTSGYASSQCISAEVSAIQAAEVQEGLQPLTWNATLAGLSAQDQVFVVANEERLLRGLPAISGLTTAADQVAAQAAQAGEDPGAPPGATAYFGNWAEDYGGLGAMFDWMYNDGPGSFNVDCPPQGGSGCWVHRDDILLDTAEGTWVAPSGEIWVGGAACAFNSDTDPSYLDNCTLEWALVPTADAEAYDFTWQQALADGA